MALGWILAEDLQGHAASAQRWLCSYSPPRPSRIAADDLIASPARLGSEKTAIPVHRLMQTGVDQCELRMGRIDQYIMIEPGHNARHPQDVKQLRMLTPFEKRVST